MPADAEETIMYDENKSNEERFKEIWQKALEKRNRYDFLYLSPDAGMVTIRNFGRFKIKNAFILAQSGNLWREWEISNYKPLKCSDIFSFCAKSLWNISVCAGKEDDDSSYFFYKDMDDKAPIDFFAIGALETAEYALAFCFNWREKKNHYIVAEREQVEDSDLFYIMNAMKELSIRKDVVYGTVQEQDEWPI